MQSVLQSIKFSIPPSKVLSFLASVHLGAVYDSPLRPGPLVNVTQGFLLQLLSLAGFQLRRALGHPEKPTEGFLPNLTKQKG